MPELWWRGCSQTKRADAEVNMRQLQSHLVVGSEDQHRSISQAMMKQGLCWLISSVSRALSTANEPRKLTKTILSYSESNLFMPRAFMASHIPNL
jgi:hypothetical protein